MASDEVVSQLLIEAQSASLYRSAHAEEFVSTRQQEERCDHYCVHFVESGAVVVGAAGERWRVGRGDVLAWSPEIEQTYTHLRDAPSDVCLTIRYNDHVEVQALDRIRRPVLPATNRLAFLRWRLDAVLVSLDNMSFETWAADLISAVTDGGGDPPPFGDRQFRWYAAKIESVRRMLVADFSEEHSLTSLANAAAMSPFHFARLFRTLVGVPPHRYLRDVRLDRALEMLRDGEPVTTTCWNAGFGNLSHFIRSFRRRFGCAPSEVRKKPQVNASPRAS